MKKTLLLFIILLGTPDTYSQELSIYLAGGIIKNSIPINEGISRAKPAGTALTPEIGFTGTFKNWQAGIGVQRFGMGSNVYFDFERDILPDKSVHDYRLLIGYPIYCPYVFGNYKIPVGKTSYVFGGVRGGMLFSNTADPDSIQPWYYHIIIPVNKVPVYGLQCGYVTNITQRFNGGFTVSWQQSVASYDLTYKTYYYKTINGKPRSQDIVINKHFDYKINMYAVRLFFQFTLFNKTPRTPEAENAEIE